MTTTAEITSRIQYNRANRDYDCFVTIDGDEAYIGSARNYSEGETKCNAYAYDHYSDNHTPEVCAELVLSDEPIADSAPALLEGAGGYYFCMIEDCVQTPRHIVDDNPLCCYHYSEETGEDCGCDDAAAADYDDAMTEQSMGTYNGKTPADPTHSSLCRCIQCRTVPIPAPELLAEADALLSDGPRCPGTGLADCGERLPAGALFCANCTQIHQRIRWAALYPETQERWIAAGREWEHRSARILANVTAMLAPTCSCGAPATQHIPAGRGLVQPACDVCADGLLLAPIVRRVLRAA